MSKGDRPEIPDGYEYFDPEGEIEFSEAELAWFEVDEEEYDWVTKMDREILEVLLVSKLILTPSIIAENIGRSRSGVSRRLNSLQAGGLVDKEGRGKYSISKLGAGYVVAGPVPTSN